MNDRMEAAHLPSAAPDPARQPRPLIGELLVAAGALSEQSLAEALAQQTQVGHRLGEILVARGLITTRALAEALAAQHGLEFVDLARVELEGAAVNLLAAPFARRYQALPIRMTGAGVLVAIADPTNVYLRDQLAAVVGEQLVLAVAEPGVLEGTIARTYRIKVEVREGDDEEEAPPEESFQDLLMGDTSGALSIDVVNSMLVRAIEEDASDLHFDPTPTGMIVRARIDGVLRRMSEIPRSLQTQLVGRLKIMGKLDITERRLPQDGRFSILVGGEPMDVRMACVPSKHGERIVLRLLHHRGIKLTLPELGMSRETQESFLHAIRQPDGAIIVCGPTGSGKTTTLYAALDLLNEEKRAIATIEDPVEYQIAGLQQMEVFSRIGLTFASGLRSLLRADPDVLLVGEIRDEETAKIATQASLTGHLVLTTLHTKNAVGSVARLKDMGVEPSLLATAINCIVGQRLARRLCLHCREPYAADPAEVERAGMEAAPDVLYRGRGCIHCGGTGYRGRVALYELLPIRGGVRAALEGPTEGILAAARAEGMTTLREEGNRLCLAGITSLEEVARVVGETL